MLLTPKYLKIWVPLLIVTLFSAGLLANYYLHHGEAADLAVISNQATVTFCKEGDTTAQCDQAKGLYTYTVESNLVSTEVQNLATPTPTATPSPTPTPTTTPSPEALSFTVGPSIGKSAATSIKIDFTTSLPSTAIVSYGTTATNLSTTKADTTLAPSHSMSLTGLQPSTKYYVQVKATSASGATVTSSVYVARTSRR